MLVRVVPEWAVDEKKQHPFCFEQHLAIFKFYPCLCAQELLLAVLRILHLVKGMNQDSYPHTIFAPLIFLSLYPRR